MITQSILASHLTYSPSSGLFTWNQQRGRVKKGEIAGTVNSNGYTQIRINGRIYLAHRLAWLYVHGEFPKPMIDNVNRNRQDNKIQMLSLATKRQNAQNTLT